MTPAKRVSICTHTCVYIYIYAYIYIHTYVRTYIHTYIYLFMYKYVQIKFMHICFSYILYIYISIYIYIYLCVCICTGSSISNTTIKAGVWGPTSMIVVCLTPSWSTATKLNLGITSWGVVQVGGEIKEC